MNFFTREHMSNIAADRLQPSLPIQVALTAILVPYCRPRIKKNARHGYYYMEKIKFFSKLYSPKLRLQARSALQPCHWYTCETNSLREESKPVPKSLFPSRFCSASWWRSSECSFHKTVHKLPWSGSGSSQRGSAAPVDATPES